MTTPLFQNQVKWASNWVEHYASESKVNDDCLIDNDKQQIRQTLDLIGPISCVEHKKINKALLALTSADFPTASTSAHLLVFKSKSATILISLLFVLTRRPHSSTRYPLSATGPEFSRNGRYVLASFRQSGQHLDPNSLFY